MQTVSYFKINRADGFGQLPMVMSLLIGSVVFGLYGGLSGGQIATVAVLLAGLAVAQELWRGAGATLQGRRARRVVLLIAGVVTLLAMPDIALAQSAPPWESFMAKLACWGTGPWVKWAAVLAIAIGGIMFGLGELNGPFKMVLQISAGFSFAAGAVGIAALLIPGGSGLTC